MKKQVAGVVAVILLATSMTGCGMSEEAKKTQSLLDALPATYSAGADEQMEAAKAAYDALPEQDKKKVDKSVLDSLEQSMINQYAAGVNEKITALEVTVGSRESIQDMHKALREIFAEIEKTPKAVDVHIDYDMLSEKMEKENEALASICASMSTLTDIEATTEILNIAHYMNATTRPASIYSYCVDIETELDKMSGKNDATELRQELRELKDLALFHEDEVKLAIAVFALHVSSWAGTVTDNCWPDGLEYWEKITGDF